MNPFFLHGINCFGQQRDDDREIPVHFGHGHTFVAFTSSDGECFFFYSCVEDELSFLFASAALKKIYRYDDITAAWRRHT